MNSSQTILLVEDDPYDQDLFISALRGMKNTPTFELVNNGKEAIEWLYRALLPPKIVFLDINMPLMDGWEFLEEFERLPEPTRNKCYVIMLTSSIDTSDIERARRYSSVIEFVSKPLTKDKLKLLESQ